VNIIPEKDTIEDKENEHKNIPKPEIVISKPEEPKLTESNS